MYLNTSAADRAEQWEPKMNATSTKEYYCLPFHLLELCIALAALCILQAVILGVMCITLIKKSKRRNTKSHRISDTRQYMISQNCSYDNYGAVLLNPKEDGTFTKPLLCLTCQKYSTSVKRMCVHFSRIQRFLLDEANNRGTRKLVRHKHSTESSNNISNLSALTKSHDSAATLDLNEILKQFTWINSSCSMLYSACDISSSFDRTNYDTENDTNNNNNNNSRRSSFTTNFLDPIVKVAKKMSFVNGFSSQRRSVSQSSNLSRQNQIFDDVNDAETTCSSPKNTAVKRKFADMLTRNHVYLNGFKRPAELLLNASSLLSKRPSSSSFVSNSPKLPNDSANSFSDNRTPKIVVHPCSVRRPRFRLPSPSTTLKVPTLNKKHSVSAECLSVQRRPSHVQRVQRSMSDFQTLSDQKSKSSIYYWPNGDAYPDNLSATNCNNNNTSLTNVANNSNSVVHL